MIQMLSISIEFHQHNTQFEVAAQQVERESHDTYMQLLQENRENLLQAQTKKKISTNDSTNEFAQMLETMTQTQEKIFKVRKEVEENLSILETRQETLEALKIQSTQNRILYNKVTKRKYILNCPKYYEIKYRVSNVTTSKEITTSTNQATKC